MTVAYGGAIYATLPAAQLGLTVTPEHLGELIALGREIKWALNDTEHAVHPTDPRLNGIYGTIWFDDLGDADGAGAPAQRDRLRRRRGRPVAVRLGHLRPARGARRRRPPARRHRAAARLDRRQHVHRHGAGAPSTSTDVRAVIPQVTGMAYRTGEHVFSIDPHDPLVPGFVLR